MVSVGAAVQITLTHRRIIVAMEGLAERLAAEVDPAWNIKVSSA